MTKFDLVLFVSDGRQRVCGGDGQYSIRGMTKWNRSPSGWPDLSQGAPPRVVIRRWRHQWNIAKEQTGQTRTESCLAAEARHIGALKAVFRPAPCSAWWDGASTERVGGSAVQEAHSSRAVVYSWLQPLGRSCNSSKNSRMVCRR